MNQSDRDNRMSQILRKVKLPKFDDIQMRLYDSIRGPMSLMLSSYHAKHVFVRCPECGNEYPIDDPELNLGEEVIQAYKRKKGHQFTLQCDKFLSDEDYEKLKKITHDDNPRCEHQFSLHEGLVEYKSQAELHLFSRGKYTAVEEGIVDLSIGKSIEPELRVEFDVIDNVRLIPAKSQYRDLFVLHWYPTGRNHNKFRILSSERQTGGLGHTVRVRWEAVGLRKLSEQERESLNDDPWKSFLILASRALREYDTNKSVLLSFNAFELFLENHIENHWVSPHLTENRDYLNRVAGFSTETKVRILIHEALGIEFVGSQFWKDWLRAKAFRNQVAHGGRLEETEYKGKKIANRFKSDRREIAKFCYTIIVKSIYFIRYWQSSKT